MVGYHSAYKCSSNDHSYELTDAVLCDTQHSNIVVLHMTMGDLVADLNLFHLSGTFPFSISRLACGLLS